MKDMVPVERIENKIFLIRGQKVMLDLDLSELYGVTNRNLKRQVRRNPDRFPPDFMFVLNQKEVAELVCQFGAPFRSRLGGAHPFAFTEHGILMLSSVLNSKKAVQVNIRIMRIFIKLRQALAENKELARKFEELEQRVGQHDAVIDEILDAIRELMTPIKTEAIGFRV